MRLAQHVVDAAAAKGFESLKAMLATFLTHAVGTGHAPVVPGFACNASWVRRDEMAARAPPVLCSAARTSKK